MNRPLWRAMAPAVALAVAGWLAGTLPTAAASGASTASPTGPDGGCTPSEWTSYAGDPAHNAVFQVPGCTLAASWSFAVPGALPSGTQVPAADVPAWRDLVGFPIGDSVAGGVVYAPNDNGRLYALNLRTGQRMWSFWARNEIMTTPLVVPDSAHGGDAEVILGVGNSDFSYSQAKRFAVPGATVARGTGFNALDAVDARTGRLMWSIPTAGEVMPTPVLAGGRVVFADGSGDVEGVDPTTGAVSWHASVGSFDSMSSLDISGGVVVFGGTHPSDLYGVSAATGAVLWRLSPTGVYSSSMGDGTPAVSGGVAVTQIETASATPGMAGTEEIAVNAATGTLLWATLLGSGRVPPRNKDANPIIVHGTVYTGSPVTSRMYAINLSSGRVEWATALPARMKAAPTLVDGQLLEPTAAGTVVALDPSTGSILHTWSSGHGGYGPQNLVVVARTALIGTNLGWMQAVPLRNMLASP